MASDSSDSQLLTPATGIPLLPEASTGDPSSPGEERVRLSTFPIIGVGASAGGLKALTTFFGEIPAAIGMAFVVVQHLDPTHASLLPDLLAKNSRLTIATAVDGVAVQPDHVYVIAPNTRIGIRSGVLSVTPREHAPRPHSTIDVFLETLALDRPGSAIAILLSGTGSDGTLGLAAIKNAGGITFAQGDSAEYPDMPRNAIIQGNVDFVLQPREIAQELGRFARLGFPAHLFTPAPDPVMGEAVSGHDQLAAGESEHYQTIIALLQAATGIDFTHYRSATILRRAKRRMAMVSQDTLAGYARYATAVPREIDVLAKDILIHVTSFYRDQQTFDALKTVVFPELVTRVPLESPIRMWIVGCSTGQEVYSLAIELVEQLGAMPASKRVQIFATDISDRALATARHGYYPASVAEQIPADRLARYFTREPHGFRIIKAIRDLCVFAKHDVTVDTPFSHLDLISCRNVLIYLGPVLQKHVLPTFHFALRPGGFLVLGSSESLGTASALYETIDERQRIYRSQQTNRIFKQPPLQHYRTGELLMPKPLISPVVEMQRAADHVVLGRFAPAGVLITDTMEVIQFRGRTNPYLEPAPGDVNLNLLAMVPFGVAESLRAALAQAKQECRAVRCENVPHIREHAARIIAFEIVPIKLPANNTCFLVLFEEDRPDEPASTEPRLFAKSKTVGMEPEAVAETSADQREIHQLRTELTTATAYVRSLTDQLKESHEEAQASLEEFRSTNEELQTTKEEIESTNEELTTINEELRTANEDIAKGAAALRASGAFTSAIVQTMRYPLLVLNADLSVETANQAFFDTFGVERQKTIGRLVYDLGNGQWNIPELRRLLEDILPNNSAFDDFEVTHDFSSIGRKTMLLNARRLHGEDDRLRLIVLVIADVTERVRVARDLEGTAAELRRSNNELDQFAAMAAHDLQEPLRMISSYMGLLQERYGAQFDERARMFMGYVTEGAKRMSAMMHAILSFSRLGHEACNVLPIDSTGPFRDAVENLTSKIQDAHATIIDSALPHVLANREQLTQLFQNLLGNALKYRSDQRRAEIQVSACEEGDHWVFAIADNGIGMNESDHDRIFLLFQRLGTGREISGCGIGLAVCKKIVEHHAGRIWVKSQIGVGSTFYFTLPNSASSAGAK